MRHNPVPLCIHSEYYRERNSDSCGTTTRKIALLVSVSNLAGTRIFLYSCDDFLPLLFSLSPSGTLGARRERVRPICRNKSLIKASRQKRDQTATPRRRRRGISWLRRRRHLSCTHPQKNGALGLCSPRLHRGLWHCCLLLHRPNPPISRDREREASC